MSHFLGIDLGTSGCRTSVIDMHGRVQAETRATLGRPQHPGSPLEQDPQDWWDALAGALDALQEALPLGSVAGLAIDATSGTLLLADARGRPLTPALMYNDARAVDQARQISIRAPAASAAHGASSSLAKLLYLQATGAADKARYALHQADWLGGRLAGRFGITDENNALKLGYDPVTRRWPDWLDALGVERRLLPEVVPAGQPVGFMATEYCRRWGFAPDTRLVSGTTDSTAGFIATGAGPAEAVTALGSTLVLKVRSTRPVFAPGYGVYSHRLGNDWLVGGASNSGGNVLRRFFSQADIERLTAGLQPQRPTGLDYYPLASPGERFPENNPGLQPRLTPRPVDDGLFFQGLLEGIAAIEQRGYHLLGQLGAPYPRRVQTVGGGAVNTAWARIREARLGVPVMAARHQEAAYGAALLARQGLIGSRQTP
jgi:sugar (pentulose or hexulose) kinase